MVENFIRGGTCHTAHRYAKGKNKYTKDYDKNKEQLYPEYQNVNNFYRRTMSQKLPVNDFKWVEDISEYDEIFIKSYYKESDEEYFF